MSSIVALLAAAGAASPAVGTAKSLTGDPAGTGPDPGSLFRGLLGASGPPATAPSSPAHPMSQAALQAKIGKLIEAGATDAQIVATLAAQLAGAVAAQLRGPLPALQTPGSDARAKLQATFAAALAPPGDRTEPAGSAADRARAMAQRYIRLEGLALSLAGTVTGQQNRFAGFVSDAQGAKDFPAQLSAATGHGILMHGDAPPRNGAPASGVLRTGAKASAVLRTGAKASAVLQNGAPASAVLRNVAPASAVRPNVTPAQSRLAVALPAVVPSVHSAPLPPLPAPALSLPTAQDPAAAVPADRAPGMLGASLTTGESSLDSPPLFAPLPAPGAPGMPVAPGTARGDGKTVALGAKPAIAGGGDSSLGRTLTRASLAADARREPVAAALRGTRDVTPERDAASSPPAADATVDAFIKTLSATLAATPAEAAAAPALDASGAIVPALAPSGDRSSPPVSAEIRAAVPEPIDHSAIADQVLRGAFMRNVGESSEMRLSLVPESLGDVNVKLVVNDGSVSAHVVAETPEVRDALVAAQPQLTKQLADAGLKLSGFTVDLSGGFAGFEQHGRNESSDDRLRRVMRSGALDDDTDDEALEAIPSFGPSAAVKPQPGDYNYLA